MLGGGCVGVGVGKTCVGMIIFHNFTICMMISKNKTI